jgi:hypothetical protein
MTFLTINAHNRMLDVTCHRNIESAYLTLLSLLSDRIERGGGGRRGIKNKKPNYGKIHKNFSNPNLNKPIS